MPEAPREARIQALIAVLETMTGTRPGWGGQYPNEIQVFRGWKAGEAVNHRPSLGVAEDSDSIIEIDVTTGAQVGIKHTFEVLVIGYTKGTEAASASTWMERLWDDLMTTLYANDTLTGLLSGIMFGPRGTDMGMLLTTAEFVQPLTLIFHESKSLEVTP